MDKPKLRRSERIAAMTTILTNHPGRLFSLTTFSQRLNTLKSVLSEDLAIVKKTVEYLQIGEIQSSTGVKGGIKLIPRMSQVQQQNFLDQMTKELCNPHRILPGEYIYYSDLISSPAYVQPMAEILISQMDLTKAEYVVTVETKGIPLAFAVARLMDKPLVVVRRESLMTEGSTISVNYASGTTGGMQRMVLPKKAIKTGSQVVMIDDFMRGGGTARGMRDLMKEFDIRVLDTGVMMAAKHPLDKKESTYTSLLILDRVDEEAGNVVLYPNPKLF